MQRLAGREVFTVGTRSYRGEDIMLAAQLWGETAGLERRTREGVACRKHLEMGAKPPPEAEVEDAADAWRYERDLLAADDMQEWLAERYLDTDEWLDYIQRFVLRTRWSDELRAITRSHRVSSEEVDGVVYSEAVCSGTLGELAERLAAQAAVYERLASETKGRRPAGCSQAAIRAELRALPPAVRKEGMLGLPPAECLERADHLACVMLAYRRFIDRVVTPADERRELETHVLDWTRLDCETVIFPGEEMAREAALLVREDGLPLRRAAATAGAAVEEAAYVLDDVEPPLKDRLVGALPGDLVGPVSAGDGFVLVSVRDRIEPSARDRSMRKRARDRIIERTVQREIGKRVRWRERL